MRRQALRSGSFWFNQVEAGATIHVAGFDVSAVGGRHGAVLDHDDERVNLGYIINGLVYHPGDSLHVPDQPVDTLFVPLHGSWLKTAEAIQFVREVAPKRAFGIHDGLLNERGLASINGWLYREFACSYEWLSPGASTTLVMPSDCDESPY